MWSVRPSYKHLASRQQGHLTALFQVPFLRFAFRETRTSQHHISHMVLNACITYLFMTCAQCKEWSTASGTEHHPHTHIFKFLSLHYCELVHSRWHFSASSFMFVWVQCQLIETAAPNHMVLFDDQEIDVDIYSLYTRHNQYMGPSLAATRCISSRYYSKWG